MSWFKILMKYADGSDDLQDEVFDSEEAAIEYADYLVSCGHEGAEILELSNPGDYPLDEYEDSEYEIIEVEDDQGCLE